jgi:DNA polymerase-1
VPDRTIILDGDVYAFQSSVAVEQEVDWGNGLWTLHSYLDDAIKNMEAKINTIVDGLKANRIVIALSDKKNFRYDVMPTYKANRKGKRKPVVYNSLIQYLRQEYSTYSLPGLEGDDLLGILATHPNLLKGDKVVVSIDKDMGTLPCLWLNDQRARRAMEEVGVEHMALEEFIQETTEEAADLWHMTQTIGGDTTDGYSGVPGLGELRADKLLREGKVLIEKKHTVSRGPRKGEVETRWEPGPDGTPWEIVVSAYKSAGLGEEVALQTARVARICRWTDFDYKQKTVKLWNPPSEGA